MKRIAAVAAVALSLAGAAPAAQPADWAAVAFSRSDLGGLYLLGHGRIRLLVAGAASPAWSPDGRRLAYTAPGAGGADDVFVTDADGSHRGRITRTPGLEEASPTWAPDGRRLAVDRSGTIVIVSADGARERRFAVGREPAWSPGGRQIAFVRDDDLFVATLRGGRARRLTSTPTAEASPAWSPDGRRIAFVSYESGAADLYVLDVRSRAATRLTTDPATETSPAFTANGDSVFFVSDRIALDTLWRVPSSGGEPLPVLNTQFVADPVIRPNPRTVELLPDLEQRPPADLSVRAVEGRFLLGFDSATDNLGLGPVIITARRPSRRVPTMHAAQIVRLLGGGRRTYPKVGTLRYVYSPTHEHWHVMGFQRYELRRLPGYKLLVRDRKSGFCLADHWAHVLGRVPGQPRRPVFTGYCERGRPEALSVHQGTSVGYTDRYPSHFHGQNLDITRLAAGQYVLVHRANRSLLFHELRYENNAASLRIAIAWPNGRRATPAIRVLRTCADSDRC